MEFSYNEKDFKESLFQSFENYESTHAPSSSFLEMIEKFKSTLTETQCKELDKIFCRVQESHCKTKKRLAEFIIDFFLLSDKYADLIKSSKKDKPEFKNPSSIKFD